VIDAIRIEDPCDWNYPFSKVFYDDPTVVYHGTSSSYAAAIEAEGLVAGVARFPVQVVQELVATCDAVGFRSWAYTTVKGLSRGTNLSRTAERRVYLSANFWFARDYATNTGGETVHNALRLADELLQALPTRSGPESWRIRWPLSGTSWHASLPPSSRSSMRCALIRSGLRGRGRN